MPCTLNLGAVPNDNDFVLHLGYSGSPGAPPWLPQLLTLPGTPPQLGRNCNLRICSIKKNDHNSFEVMWFQITFIFYSHIFICKYPRTFLSNHWYETFFKSPNPPKSYQLAVKAGSQGTAVHCCLGARLLSNKSLYWKLHRSWVG